MSNLAIVVMLIAYILDLIIGDPYSFPHPVRFIGNLIRFVEKKIRNIAKTSAQLKIGGFALWFITVGTTFVVTNLIFSIFVFSKIVYIVVASIILYTTLSTKCLADEARKI